MESDDDDSDTSAPFNPCSRAIRTLQPHAVPTTYSLARETPSL